MSQRIRARQVLHLGDEPRLHETSPTLQRRGAARTLVE
jgi:hypothetical protein